MEVKGLDARITLKAFRLKYILPSALSGIYLCLGTNIRYIVQFFSQHLGYQFYPWQILYGIFTHQLAIPKHRNLIAYLIDLIQKMGNENNAYTSALQIPHKAEQLLYLLFIQG